MSFRASVGCPGLKVAEHRFPEERLPSCLTGLNRTAAHAEQSRATHSPAASATAEPCGRWHAPQIPQETVAVVFVPETSAWPALEPAACGAPAPAPGPGPGRGHTAGGRPHAPHRARTPRASACGAAPSASVPASASGAGGPRIAPRAASCRRPACVSDCVANKDARACASAAGQRTRARDPNSGRACPARLHRPIRPCAGRGSASRWQGANPIRDEPAPICSPGLGSPCIGVRFISCRLVGPLSTLKSQRSHAAPHHMPGSATYRFRVDLGVPPLDFAARQPSPNFVPDVSLTFRC